MTNLYIPNKNWFEFKDFFYVRLRHGDNEYLIKHGAVIENIQGKQVDNAYIGWDVVTEKWLSKTFLELENEGWVNDYAYSGETFQEANKRLKPKRRK